MGSPPPTRPGAVRTQHTRPPCSVIKGTRHYSLGRPALLPQLTHMLGFVLSRLVGWNTPGHLSGCARTHTNTHAYMLTRSYTTLTHVQTHTHIQQPIPPAEVAFNVAKGGSVLSRLSAPQARVNNHQGGGGGGRGGGGGVRGSPGRREPCYAPCV